MLCSRECFMMEMHASAKLHKCFTANKKEAVAISRQPPILSEPCNYFFNDWAIIFPISAGLATTAMPHSSIIFILAAAVSSAPPTMAPA